MQGAIPIRGMLVAAAVVAVCVLVPATSHAVVEVSFDVKRERTGGYAYRLHADRFLDQTYLGLSVRRGRRKDGHGRRLTTFYIPLRGRPSVSRKRINARLGRRGSIGLRFRARSRRVQRFGCVSRVVARGSLRGHLRFRGEAGYVRILDHRLRARRIAFRANCARASRPRPKPVLLAACRARNLFGARQFPNGRTDFVGLNGLRINRGLFSSSLALVSARARRFSFADDLSSARVDPPRPFRGEGVFEADSDGSGALSGSLRGSFPWTKRLRFAPASGQLVRARQVGCESLDSARAAGAASYALRAAGAGWLRVR